MSESMRDPMQRQLTSGRRSTPAALLPGEPRPSTETSILAISARSAWTPRRWRSCQRPGVTRWVSVRCVPGLTPVPPANRDAVPACLICADPPGPGEDATAMCSIASTPGTRCDVGSDSRRDGSMRDVAEEGTQSAEHGRDG